MPWGIRRTMSGQQKRGFRLPWGAASDPDGGAAAATLEPGTPDPTTGAVRDDLGDGPFGLADAPPQLTTDADPAASDVPESNTEAAMIETETSNQAAQEAPARAPAGGAWPDTDTAARAGQRPAIRVDGEPGAPRVPRRDNPLVAGLVKAMREAAIASREETTARLQGEATARIETIKTRATSEVGELKKRADEDVAGIREWSKAEMARIKQATDDRIEARRTELEGETQRHAAGVAQLVDEVETVVLQFEEDMDQFFVQLLAEEDPAKLAALAEQAPEPPDLRGDGPTALDLMQEPAEDPRAAIQWESVETPPVEPAEASADAPTTAPVLEAAAAAEAEAAATEGLDLADADQWPATVTAAARRGDPTADADAAAAAAADADGAELTRLVVSGLSSVAGISAFKGALGTIQGVRAVSVTSGERGTFVFQIHHDPDVDLASGVASLNGFAARITDATADGVTVVAHEPAA